MTSAAGRIHRAEIRIALGQWNGALIDLQKAVRRAFSEDSTSLRVSVMSRVRVHDQADVLIMTESFIK